MGYYTKYTLEVRGIKTEEEFKALHKELDDRGLFGYVFEDDDKWDPWDRRNSQPTFFSYYEAVKWYEEYDVMHELSRLFPEMVFHISAAGEDYDDIWDAYYQDGKCESGGVKHYTPMDIPWDASYSLAP